jgi:hypothetical protein
MALANFELAIQILGDITLGGLRKDVTRLIQLSGIVVAARSTQIWCRIVASIRWFAEFA